MERTAVHFRTGSLLSKCYSGLTKDRTVLVIKDRQKRNTATNFRPITCLALGDELYEHLEEQNLLPDEKNGCEWNCKRRKTRSWDDLGGQQKNKCYDPTFLVSSNVYEYLALLKICCHCWKKYESMAGGIDIRRKYPWLSKCRRGMFQGDSPSPLLIVLTLIPFSVVLSKAKLKRFIHWSSESSEREQHKSCNGSRGYRAMNLEIACLSSPDYKCYALRDWVLRYTRHFFGPSSYSVQIAVGHRAPRTNARIITWQNKP